jgi:hypothetical protein
MTPRLDLDFHRPPRAPRRAGWLLLAIATAFAADVGWSWLHGKDELAMAERQLAARPARAANGNLVRVALQPPSTEEMALARETIRRIAMPWEDLFASLEFAQSERVALLAVEPDPERGTVVLTGEARDYLAALTYVATLANAKGMSRVHLSRHETKANDPQRRIAFTVSAQWRSPR